MSYLVLARKWRPKNFDDVIGQNHVVRALQNALAQQRLHHAYLFTGTRGVGKTTLARILAKAFNCEQGISATPCGKCDACLEIDEGKFIDLIEVDAASRTKVEDTRDLLENIHYLPTKARFKIYLIDEVHMLSNHSFNALLKTLEEPPEHVKFLLATTDPQKLPITVLSRCLQFNLKIIPEELLQLQLQSILKHEAVTFEEDALHKLAVAAQGSARDALSLLDQAIAYGNGTIVTSDVDTMLGTIATTHLVDLVQALADQDGSKILTTIAQLNELAVDFSNVLDALLNTFHQLTILQTVPNFPNTVSQFTHAFTAEELQLYYQIALIGKRDLPLAPTPKTGFEMVLLRMLAFCLAKKPQPQADVLPQLNLTGPTQAIIQHCVLENYDDQEVHLLLDPAQAPLLNKKLEERLAVAFSEYFHKPMQVTIKLGTANMPTAAYTMKQELAQKHQNALTSIANDPTIDKLVKTFDAKIINESIKYD